MGGPGYTLKNAASGCVSRWYFLALNSSTGIATTHWERNEENRTRPQFTIACLGLSAIGGGVLLTDSRIEAAKKYGLRLAVARLERWRNFHKPWIRKAKPWRPIPTYFPLPNNRPDEPDGEISPIDSEDGGPIMGEEDSDACAESSLEDAPSVDYLPIDISW